MFTETVKRIDTLARRRRLYPFALAGWAGLILVLSVTPGVAGDLNSGLAAHVWAYFVLALMVVFWLQSAQSTQVCIKAAVYAGLYGFLIECLQYFIPYRAFEAADVAVNTASAALAAIVGYFMIRRQWI